MYEMQILIYNQETHKKEWKSVHPTHGKAYQYKTFQEAVDMLEMCYPDEPREELRVIKVN